MKNRYALNSNNDVVHINEINKVDRQLFSCCNCGDRMIARKGNINTHHFAHKTTSCSYESYLHRVAKLKFFLAYSKCLVKKIPFTLEYYVDKHCNSCREELLIDCYFENSTRRYNLTQTFDKITIEKGIDGFIADVLLESSKSPDKLLIEFAVKHYRSTEKKQSGLRIVEIAIDSGSDLEALSENGIHFNNIRYKLYNFKKKQVTDSFIKPFDCKNRFHFFSIDKAGRAYFNTLEMRVIRSELYADEYSYYQIIEERNRIEQDILFIDLVEKYTKSGIKIVNCHACRFIKLNMHKNKIYPWFCAKHKQEIEETSSGCDQIWRIS